MTRLERAAWRGFAWFIGALLALNIANQIVHLSTGGGGFHP